MWTYWIIFFVPAIFSLNEGGGPYTPNKKLFSNINFVWVLVIFFYSIVIGWRHRVGGDWYAYINLYNIARNSSQYYEWWLNDPAYRALEWFGNVRGWDIYDLNLLSAIIFTVGLVVFCTNMPRKWLALTVSVPYVVIILGMGYTRQGIAIGVLMIAFTLLKEKSTLGFVIFAVIASMFHKSAVLIIPLSALVVQRNRFYSILLIGIIAILSYFIFLEDSVDKLTHGYIDKQYQSEGALIRLIMNLIPAAIILFNPRKFLRLCIGGSLWIWMSLIAVVLFLVYFVSPSSTAVDRIALYVIPLQIVVFSYLPSLLSNNKNQEQFFVILIILYYGAVQFVWLNYAKTAFAWVPYNSYISEYIF